LICGGKRIKKKRTSTKRNTLNPIWNEAIVFNLRGKDLCCSGPASTSSCTSSSFGVGGSGTAGNGAQQGSNNPTTLPGVQLEMTVFNDNLLGTNEPLGRVLVGDQVTAGPAAAQWMELLAARNAPARWHVLQHQHSNGDG
jgi:C2 domain